MMELTQAELAKEIDVSRQTVVSIEGGDYAPSVYLALKLAEVLETTVEELFGDAGEKSQWQRRSRRRRSGRSSLEESPPGRS